ncbi:MAG: carbamoyltransferase HypF [Chlorobi bacterium]|nr:carbamoyltransferase HypF [Chlorobiota bacterium]
MPPKLKKIRRKRIYISGIVQGVGFRPFVYNLANNLNLKGFVTNTVEGVLIEAEGEDVNRFIRLLTETSPPLSEINEIKFEEISPLDSKKFEIIKSGKSLGNKTLISPDVSICDDCLTELFDENNRRFLYPFINCTNCGPRFTIIENIPYDRHFTTMKDFNLCEPCRTEYENPADRRFHAQPNACADCGPFVWIENDNGMIKGNTQAFNNTADRLLDGDIAAVKGLGGFHLCCLASDVTAVKKLRKRKHRRSKPFAVMVPDLETAESLASISAAEKQTLTSKERPIVLLRKKHLLPEIIAPDNKRVGVMLPYTPLHYIIFYYLKKKLPEGSPLVLIMTSANISEEPICISNEDAKNRLSGIADFYLLHNRKILIRADDSVGIFINGGFRMIRRSRGYVPRRIKLLYGGGSILAVGGELKNTICITKENNAFISQHIGNGTNLRANNYFVETIEHLQKIMDTNAETVVCDMHPDYFSTRWAINSGLPLIKVQHHHAHLASCMLENNLDENVIGVILDGTGYGYDSTIWGGEILFGNYAQVERLFHLQKMPLPGGDAAAKEPWRTAIGFLYACDPNKKVPEHLRKYPYQKIHQMIDGKINTPLTSSAGRLFDAVSALAGGIQKNSFEAEAAIHIMHAAAESNTSEKYIYDSPAIKGREILIDPIILGVNDDVINKIDYSVIAKKFHNTLIRLFCSAVEIAAEMKQVKKIVLSGGVFQNEILSAEIENILEKKGLEIFTNKTVSANDGGISLGQAAIASKLLYGENPRRREVLFIN